MRRRMGRERLAGGTFGWRRVERARKPRVVARARARGPPSSDGLVLVTALRSGRVPRRCPCRCDAGRRPSCNGRDRAGRFGQGALQWRSACVIARILGDGRGVDPSSAVSAPAPWVRARARRPSDRGARAREARARRVAFDHDASASAVRREIAPAVTPGGRAPYIARHVVRRLRAAAAAGGGGGPARP